MLFDFAGDILKIPKVKSVDQGTCPPFRKDTIEVNRDDGIIGALSIGKGESDDGRVVAVEVLLYLALEVVAFHIFVILDEDELLSDQTAM